MANVFPNAKFIHVIRDGRDTVMSLPSRPAGRGSDGIERRGGQLSRARGKFLQGMGGQHPDRMQVRQDEPKPPPHHGLFFAVAPCAGAVSGSI